ncbi:tetratricopeptide repeat protein [candidate division GN15 bacterium]|nr:tetratricopeptide repeat protein [candidate division GN15 bacterium]
MVSLPAGTGVQSALVRGSHYYTAGDYQAALAWYQQAQDLDPTFPEVHLNLGAAWLRLGQADSAMHYFREEIATHPERAKAYANLGSVLLLEDRPREARLNATDAFQRQPYDILAIRVLLRSAAAETSLAADSLLAVIDSITNASDTNVYAMNEAGQALVTRRLLARAADVYRLAAASEPPPIEMDDAAFDRNFPNSPERWRAERAHSYFQLGFLAGLDNRWEDAVRFNIRAITLDAASLEPHLNLVAALQHVGRPQKADSVLQVTRQRFGDDAISRVLQQRR